MDWYCTLERILIAKIQINSIIQALIKHLLFPATKNNDEELDSPHFNIAHNLGA